MGYSEPLPEPVYQPPLPSTFKGNRIWVVAALSVFVCSGLSMATVPRVVQSVGPTSNITVANSSGNVYAEYEQALVTKLTQINNLPKVQSVYIAPSVNGNRRLVVRYLTGQTSQKGYNDEWIALTTEIAQMMPDASLKVGSLELVFGISSDAMIGTFTTDLKNVESFFNKTLNRAQFLNLAKYIPNPTIKPTKKP